MLGVTNQIDLKFYSALKQNHKKSSSKLQKTAAYLICGSAIQFPELLRLWDLVI